MISGHDPNDSTSATAPVGAYEAACERDIKGLRLGVPEEYFSEGLDPDVERSVRGAIEALEGQGCEVRPVALPVSSSCFTR